MTVDTQALRKTHIDGWRPRQSVELDVETLRALLDEIDAWRAAALTALRAAVQEEEKT